MRYIYFHGFASGPSSRKARAFRAAFAARGIDLEVPDLACGDFEHLTLSSQLELAERLLEKNECRLLGSSMGGYLAALYASRHPEVDRMVLLAPAFHFQGRWPDLLGQERFADWRQSGWLEVQHYATGVPAKVHFGLFEDAGLWPPAPRFGQPAIAFHGVHDDVVPVWYSREVASVLPNVRLIELDSDHELTAPLDEIIATAMPFLTAP